VLEDLAEGYMWQKSERAVRFAAPLMGKSTVYKGVSPALTREEEIKRSNISCMLWYNESLAGQKLLPTEGEEEGSLLKEWKMNERIPDGFFRQEGGFSAKNE